MSIRKIGNRWQVRVRIGAGQRIERTLPPTATLKDARLVEANIRTAQVDSAVGRKPRYTLDQALEQWEKAARGLKSWERDVKYRLEVIRGYSAGLPLEALPDVAEKLKDRGRDSLTPGAINRYLAILRRVGNLAERWGWTDKPIGRRVQLLPENGQRHVYLTREQVQRIAKHADPETADLILFAALTGLRRGELFRLTPESVRDGVLTLNATTKSGRPRGIPLHPEAARIAQRRLPVQMSEWQLRTRWEAARAAAGLDEVHFHDLRHTFASWLVQGQKPLTAVRDLLGHSSLSVTSRYAHLAPAHLVDAITALPDLGVGKRRGTKKASKGRKKAA